MECKKTFILIHISVEEKLLAQRKFDNQFNKFAVKLLNSEETVGHLPRKFAR